MFSFVFFPGMYFLDRLNDMAELPHRTISFSVESLKCQGHPFMKLDNPSPDEVNFVNSHMTITFTLLAQDNIKNA